MLNKEHIFANYYRITVRSSLATLVTHSLPLSCLVDLLDVTLACEDANSNVFEVVSVTVVDAEKHVDDSLVQI